MVQPAEALEGKKYNKLTILKYLRSNKLYKRVYLCQCDCGNLVELVGSSVKSGNNKACGCQKGNPTHRLTNHPLYQKHADMKTRCSNENNEFYYCYGAKGIKVCDEWLDFKSFYTWAINNGWKEGLTIERVDSSKDYEPDNCEFITLGENSRRNIVTLSRGNDGKLRKRAEENL